MVACHLLGFTERANFFCTYLYWGNFVYFLLVIVENFGEHSIEGVDEIFQGSRHGVAAVKVEAGTGTAVGGSGSGGKKIF